MRILFISMYFYPENGSSDYFIRDIKNHLFQNGFDISTVTPNPVRDLDSDTISEYKDKTYEMVEGQEIYRLFCGTNNSNSVKNRVKRLITYKRKLKKFLKHNIDKFDCIYIPSNPPIFIPLMVEKICKKHHKKFIYSITDIWPQITGKYSFLNRFARKAINKADHIVTLSNDMKLSIQNISKREKDIEVIRIWPDDSIFNISKCDDFDYSVISQDTHNVFYIGNIGAFQNIDQLLDVAKSLNDNKTLKFYLVGSGRKKNDVVRRINEEKIDNVIFISRVSNDVASSLYRLADLNIVSLNKDKIFYACPSKTSTCLYAGKPCLMILDKSQYSDELIGNNYFYLDNSFDTAHIAESITNILNRKEVNQPSSKRKFENIYEKKYNLDK